MQEKWLIASDLDGTLFQIDHQISTRTLNAMHMMINQGHSMVLITGRSLYSAIPRLLSIPEGVRLVCSNGAYEYDRKMNEIVWAYYISADIAADIQQRILRVFPSASFGWESKSGLAYEPEFISEAGGAHTLEQGGFHDPSEQHDLLKMFVRSPGKMGAEISVKLSDILHGEVEVYSSGAPFAEITAVGVNKGSALAKVAFDLDIESYRTLAFGDNQNDSPMLRWAGKSVAMANAINEVKELADIQTLGNTDDGVAHYLEGRFYC